MHRLPAVFLGVLSTLPLMYALLFIFDALSLEPGVNPTPWPLAEQVDWHLVAMILSGALFFLYVAMTYLSTRVPRKMRIAWTLALFFGSVFVFPFFWYFYIWQPNSQNS
jgi:uncharacterized membrane protein